MYSGNVKGTEQDIVLLLKIVVRFADKKDITILRTESLYYEDIYLQGFSTSMPYYVQEQMVKAYRFRKC